MNKETETKPLVYVPTGAKTNVKNHMMEAPDTEYHDREMVLDRDVIQKEILGNKIND